MTKRICVNEVGGTTSTRFGIGCVVGSYTVGFIVNLTREK
jgi:hypothetical protein